jgi:hypothetical protein
MLMMNCGPFLEILNIPVIQYVAESMDQILYSYKVFVQTVINDEKQLLREL